MACLFDMTLLRSKAGNEDIYLLNLRERRQDTHFRDAILIRKAIKIISGISYPILRNYGELMEMHREYGLSLDLKWKDALSATPLSVRSDFLRWIFSNKDYVYPERLEKERVLDCDNAAVTGRGALENILKDK